MASLITAGSAKGSLLLAEVRRKYPNYHPVLAMVDIAHDDKASLELQFACHKTVAKYIEPELKSIEVKADFKETVNVRVSLFGEPDVETVGFTESGFDDKNDGPNYESVDAAILAYEG